MHDDFTHDTEHAHADDAAIREVAVRIVRQLTDAGFIAYFAGGCVRDRLRNEEPGDYDVATSATPDDVRNCFQSVHHVGESFGVSLVRMHGIVVEVATFRIDGPYRDGRHPESVTFTDAEHDARRRDFTINGLFEDPINERVIDYVGGEADLRDGVIRAIGTPDDRFREDHLRMLRAVRFAARFEYDIEPVTIAAIRHHAHHLEGVSPERIGNELRRMLAHPQRARAIGLLQDLSLDDAVLGRPGTSDLTVLAGLDPAADVETALAALLVDRCGITVAGPEARKDAVADLRRRLVLSNDEVNAVGQCLAALHDLVHGWDDDPVARRKRLAASAGFDRAMHLLDGIDANRAERIEAAVTELASTGLAPEPLITGHDLLDLGFEAGPMFRQVIDAVYDAQLEGRLASRDDALALARRLGADDA